jgi:tryptophan-rich sensory protein
MKKIDIGNLLFHVLTPILLGMAVGLLFNNFDYIDSLDKTITVPPIIFPIVWSILYLLIGIWYHFYEKESTTRNKILYYILLGLNFLFTPVLFYFENIVLALIIVILLIIGNIYLMIDSIRKGKYGFLLAPYVIWLVFAGVLMTDLLINNILM